MIRTGGNVQVWVATAPVEMRKSFDGLAEVVRAFLGHDPLSESLFVFRNRSGQRVKVLWWDKNGLAIYYKRLEKSTFALPAPATAGDKTLAISAADLARLLAGCHRRRERGGLLGARPAEVLRRQWRSRRRDAGVRAAALRGGG